MSTRAPQNRPRTGNRRGSTSRHRKQQHLLDVKVRARRASHYRNRRILLFVSRIVLVIAVAAGLYYGTRLALSRFFFDNPDYRLSTIGIRTDGTLQREQVLKAGGLELGSNIFFINLAKVRDR
jgi:cell division septal protein FtsQ